METKEAIKGAVAFKKSYVFCVVATTTEDEVDFFVFIDNVAFAAKETRGTVVDKDIYGWFTKPPAKRRCRFISSSDSGLNVPSW
jgi:hypothetical protein